MKSNLKLIECYAALSCVVGAAVYFFSIKQANRIVVKGTMALHKARIAAGIYDRVFNLPAVVLDVLTGEQFEKRNIMHQAQFNALMRKTFIWWATDIHGITMFDARRALELPNMFEHVMGRKLGYKHEPWREAAVDFLDHVEALAYEFIELEVKQL